MKCNQCKSWMKEVKITSYHFIESGLDHIYLENIKANKCENCTSASPYFDKVDEIMTNIARANKLVMQNQVNRSPMRP